jgi:hypothetical protein
MRTLSIAYLLVREINHRLAGARRDASPATTVFVAGMLASVAAQLLAPLLRPLKRPPPKPSLQSAGAAFAVGRYLTSSVGGEPLQGVPNANALIALGFLSPARDLLMIPVSLARAARAGLMRAWRALWDAAPIGGNG